MVVFVNENNNNIFCKFLMYFICDINVKLVIYVKCGNELSY